MHWLAFCMWLQNTRVGTAVRVSTWLFPLIESFHIIGLALLVGAVARLDVRLLGVDSSSSVSNVAKTIMPWVKGGFLLAVITGSLLFSSEAVGLYVNRAFRLKMLMLLLLGVNTAVYELLTRRNIDRWDIGCATPISAKLTGVISLTLWLGVVVAGRWIAYA
jgi:hypothetical protein